MLFKNAVGMPVMYTSKSGGMTSFNAVGGPTVGYQRTIGSTQYNYDANHTPYEYKQKCGANIVCRNMDGSLNRTVVPLGNGTSVVYNGQGNTMGYMHKSGASVTYMDSQFRKIGSRE